MIVPLILIKDNMSTKKNNVRLFGLNHHDALVISDNHGALTYYNMQNGDGSLGGEEHGGYSFYNETLEDIEEYPYNMYVENVAIDEYIRLFIGKDNDMANIWEPVIEAINIAKDKEAKLCRERNKEIAKQLEQFFKEWEKKR